MLLDALGCEDVVQISGRVVFLRSSVIGNPVSVNDEL